MTYYNCGSKFFFFCILSFIVIVTVVLWKTKLENIRIVMRTVNYSELFRWGNAGSKRYLDYFVDTEFLETSLKDFIPIVQSYTARWSKSTKTMMKAKVPEINYTNVRPHTLAGKNLSFSQIHRAIQDDQVVPNAAHYVLPFYKPKLEFHHLVCILSGFWVFKPKKLFLWYNEWPSGEHWNYLLRNISGLENKVVMVYRPVPNKIYTITVNVKEHKSDVIRMEALLIFGGAYFDLDVITLKSMEPLRKYPFTIGRESGSGLCNGVMLSAPNSTFLSLWHLGYQVLDDGQWASHSVHLPHAMAQKWPKHVHVEEQSMDRPNWMETNFNIW